MGLYNMRYTCGTGTYLSEAKILHAKHPAYRIQEPEVRIQKKMKNSSVIKIVGVVLPPRFCILNS